MNFHSIPFLVFFPLTVFLHDRLPAEKRWILLLAASLLFYMAWNPWMILLLLACTAAAYFSALGIEKSGTRAGKRLCLGAALAFCLGSLFVFKYFNFAFGTNFSIVLPVGISFYTFQALGYCIDVYRGDYRAEHSFGYFCLYVSFFPQLVAGPIERAGSLLPQLKAGRTADVAERAEGLFWMVRGFAKKVVVSDMAAVFADRVFAAPDRADGSAALIGALLFALQIYCDFSGYSEIALGAARILGIRLGKNFDRPYVADSLRDFWRRWHISLTGWFTDYIYLPLGGSRRGKLRTSVNTLLVFLVSGLWHGAAWTYVAWGLFHGILMTAERLLPKASRRLLTQVLVLAGWVIFRARTLSDAFCLLGKIFRPWAPADALRLLGADRTDLVLLPILFVFTFLLDREDPAAWRSNEDGSGAVRRTLLFSLLVLAVSIAWLIGWQSGAENAFIYFQF